MTDEQNRELPATPSFLEISRDVVAEAARQSDPDACLRRLRSGLIELGFRRAGILVVDPDNPSQFRGTWGTNWDGTECDEHHVRYLLAENLDLRLVFSGEKFRIQRTARPPGDAPAHAAEILTSGPPNQVSVALRADGQLYGVISVDMLPTDLTIDLRALHILDFFADQAAIILARWHDQVGRHRLEAEMSLARERLESLVANLDDVIFSIDLERGRLLEVSPSCERLFGYSREIFLARPSAWLEMVVPEHIAVARKITTAGRRGETYRETYQVIRADGERRWVQVRARPVADRNSVFHRVDGILSDVTRTREATEELKQSRREIEALYRATGRILESIDLASTLETILDSVMSLVRADLARIRLIADDGATLQYAAGRGLSSEAEEYSRRQSLRIGEGVAGVVAKTGQVLNVEDLTRESSPYASLLEPAQIRSELCVPLRVGPRIIGVLAAFSRQRAFFKPRHARVLSGLANQAALAIQRAREAEERQRAEEESRRSRERLQSVFDSLDDVILSFDLNNPGDIEISPACETVFGRPPEDFRAYPSLLLDCAHPEDGSLVDRVRDAFQEHRPCSCEHRIVRPDGSVRWIQSRIKPTTDASGRVIRMDGIVTDVTARKQFEAALRDSNRRLEAALNDLRATQEQVIQQERLRALGAMAAGVAHDFNNALAIIIGCCELLTIRPEYLSDENRVLETMTLVRTAAEDAASVVSGLREFYRAPDADEQSSLVELDGIVRQTVLMTQPRWKDQALADGKKIRVLTRLQKGARVLGREHELREVLTNLIFNAADAIRVDGTITIETRLVEGGKVRLSVADTGIGMTEEIRRRCLEPFYTTKGARGSGIGLAMVYGVIQRHHGSIEIESEVGRGTTVTISLPLGSAPVSVAPLPTRMTLESRRVLVVDDEDAVRFLVQAYLETDGHQVHAVGDGLAALNVFSSRLAEGEAEPPFDLVITDRAMPGLSGDQLAAALKALDPRVPIVLLTGFGDLMNEVGERPEGVDRVLSKPVKHQTLRDTLAEVLAGPSAAHLPPLVGVHPELVHP